MEIGIGLPVTIPGVDGKTVLRWARSAERRGFSTVGVFDRLAFDNYEPLATLAAVAGATERVRLMTSVLLAPLADQIAASAFVSPEQIVDALTSFSEAGCDELILFPCDPRLDQVDLLADAAGL